MKIKLPIAFFFFALAVYLPTLSFPFSVGDSNAIASNASIQIPRNALKIFASPSYASSSPENWKYQPLTTEMNSLAWLVGKGAPLPFRAEKVLLLFGICSLLFFIWIRLWKTPGFFPNPAPIVGISWKGRPHEWTITPEVAAAVLAFSFAVHPTNTQALLDIAASSTLLCGFFFLLSYFLYLRYRDGGQITPLVGAAAAYVLCVLAKPEGIALPAIVLLTECLLPLPTRRARKTAPILFFTLGICLALLLRTMSADIPTAPSPTRFDSFVTLIRAWPYYLRLAVWPYGLNALNTEFGFSNSLSAPAVLLALVANIAVVFAAFTKRKKYPVFLFSVLWFYIMIASASSVFPSSEPVDETRMAIASFGLFGAILPGLFVLTELIFPAPSALAAPLYSGWVLPLLLVALTATTEVRIHVWSNPVTLWTDTIKKNPHSDRAKNNLAIIDLGRGEYTEAKDLLDMAEADRPAEALTKLDLAETLSALGQEGEAERNYQAAIDLAPKSEIARLFYAHFLYVRGRYTAAESLFHEVVKMTHGASLEAAIGEAQSEKNIGQDAEAGKILSTLESQFPGHPLVIAIRREWQ